MWHGHLTGVGWWIMLLGVLFWVSIVVLVVWVVKRITMPDRHDDRRGGDRKQPMDYLRERYAKGEIDDAEYERRRRRLKEE